MVTKMIMTVTTTTTAMKSTKTYHNINNIKGLLCLSIALLVGSSLIQSMSFLETILLDDMYFAEIYPISAVANSPTSSPYVRLDSNIVGNVYSCGYNYSASLRVVFEPEYKYVPDTTALTRPNGTTDKDILLFGAYGECPEVNIGSEVHLGLVHTYLPHFHGKILIINGEPDGQMSHGNVFEFAKSTQKTGENIDDPRWSRIFQIGPYPPSPPVTDFASDDDYTQVYTKHSLKVFFMVCHMVDAFGSPPPPPPQQQLPPPSSMSSVFSFMTGSSRKHDRQPAAAKSGKTTPSGDDVGARHHDGAHDDDIWSWWTDPKQRRNNTGKYHAIAYVSSKCHHHRQNAAIQLSDIVSVHYRDCRVDNPDPTPLQYHIIDSIGDDDGSGTGNNQTTTAVPRTVAMLDAPNRDHFYSNSMLYHDYKYCLVMENSLVEGYISEKLANAFLGGCLPIYFGTREVFDVFHRDAFVFYDIANPQPALDLIRHLEANPKEYYRRLQETPILKDGQRTMDRYFSTAWSNEGNGRERTIKQRIRDMMEIPPPTRTPIVS